MNQVIELKDPKILGDEHPQYGYQVWSETDGDYPVMFNTKQGNIMPGTRVTYETAELKTSAKGNEYLRLKKIKFEDSPQTSVPFENKPKPTFHQATAEQTKKDNQITKNMVWKNLLQVYDVSSMIPESKQWNEFWGNVELHTEMLTKGNYDNLSGGSLPGNPTFPGTTNEASPLDKPAAAKSLGDTYRNRKEPELADEDIPEEYR